MLAIKVGSSFSWEHQGTILWQSQLKILLLMNIRRQTSHFESGTEQSLIIDKSPYHSLTTILAKEKLKHGFEV